MPKILTQQQVDQYYEQGFIAPIDVMAEDEALAYRLRLEEVERNYPEEIHAENRNNAHLSFKFLDELAHHPIIVGAVEDLIGTDIMLWGSVLFIKEPQSTGFVSWHQDATYMGIEPKSFVTPWLALSPSNRESGCMSMIPGSHRDHIQQHNDTFAENNLLTRGQAVNDVDESKAVDLILRPGQMSLHHAQIIHGSQPNHSQQRRIGFALQGYISSQARQVIGENYWMHVRGKALADDCWDLPRPRYDMDDESAINRKKVNNNWDDILYHGADKKRAY